MKDIKFLSNNELLIEKGKYTAHIHGAKNKEELLKKLSINLKFPDNFGSNWDALLDCFCDLNWIEEQGIVLFHDDLSNMDKSDLSIYIDILIESINTWNRTGFHYMEIYFSENDIDIIKPLINQKYYEINKIY